MSPRASKSQQSPPRWSALDLAEGLQLGHALSALHDLGVLAAMTRPRTVAELAEAFALDPEMLGAALEYAAARTDLVRKHGKRFVVGDGHTSTARFALDLYAGAFAANAVALPMLLRKPARAGAAVDRRRQAQAFARADEAAHAASAELLRLLDVRAVLDLGCGSGLLLRAMARADAEFRGWGIDANPAMCRLARAGLHDIGAARRVRIILGDGRMPARALSAHDRARVEAVVAGDLANELCARGAAAAVVWLQRLRRDFPGRLLLIADYYGRLGHRIRDEEAEGAIRQTLLHDYVQAISGQGVPPPDRKAWQGLYRQAGAQLVHCIEDTGTTRFLHLLRL